MSTESIADPDAALLGAGCRNCGAPLASDQRYCLECGERGVPISSFLLGAGASAPAAGSPPPSPPSYLAPQAGARSSALSVIAFVGVLLLAMGVGVLIGRAGNSKAASAAPVIKVEEPAGSAAARSEAAFTSSWPADTNGYTVRLQTLPVEGTSLSTLETDKASASAKGAKALGALKSEEFSSLPSGEYVIYSGVYSTRGQAVKALSGLKKSFPGASLIHLNGGSGSSSAGGAGASSGAGGSEGGSGGAGTLAKPAKPKTLSKLGHSHGKKFEEESKNLPDVVETG